MPTGTSHQSNQQTTQTWHISQKFSVTIDESSNNGCDTHCWLAGSKSRILWGTESQMQIILCTQRAVTCHCTVYKCEHHCLWDVWGICARILWHILCARVEVEYCVCLRCAQEARGAVILVVEMPTTYDNCREARDSTWHGTVGGR